MFFCFFLNQSSWKFSEIFKSFNRICYVCATEMVFELRFGYGAASDPKSIAKSIFVIRGKQSRGGDSRETGG